MPTQADNASLSSNTAGSTGLALGDIDWQNLRDNWRETDADWLQYRSVVRVASDNPVANTHNLLSGGVHKGRVFYSTASDRLIVVTGSASSDSAVGTYRAVLASDPTSGLLVTDTSTTVTLGVRYQASTSNTNQSYITFTKSTGAISVDTLTASTLTSSSATVTTLSSTTATVSNLTVSTSFSSKAGSASGATFSTGTSGVTINTNGTNSSVLTTSASGLSVNTGFSATSFSTTGSVSAGSLSITGSFSPGSISTGAITSSGTLTSSGISNTGTITSTGSISTSGGSISSNGSVTAGSSMTAATSMTVPKYTAPVGELVIETPSTSTIRVQSTSGGIVNMYHGSGTTVRNAWVVYGANAPAASTVPDGTIWIT